MKKKLLVAGLCLGLIMGMASCSSKSMSYDDYDLSEYIEVGEYTGLEVAPYTISVSEDEIDAEIESILEESATTVELDEDDTIEDEDVVNIDYVGEIDGEEFDGGSAEGYDLTIGSDTFIDGFEDGLIGKHIGDEVELDLTFPDDYSGDESLQGEDVTFTVTINSATREEVPEYDLDFVQENTDYDTLEEYETYIEESLYDEKEEEAISDQKTTLWEEAMENAEVIQYPERELEHYMDFNSDQVDELADSYSMTRTEVLSSYGYGDEDEFEAYNEEQSQTWVKQEMLMECIADAEELEYTEDEKEELMDQYVSAGYDSDTVYSQTGRTLSDYAHISLLYEKVTDFLLENAEITGAASTY